MGMGQAKGSLVTVGCPTPYIEKRRELDDTEKSIYLKLVELAKAGKIEWESEYGGKIGSYTIFAYDNGEVSISLEMTKYRWANVSCFGTCGEQLAGDLSAIAKEQWNAKREKIVEDFLNLQ